MPASAQSRSSGTAAHYDLAGAPERQSELPTGLAEISGLAFTPDGRLLAHDDEQATVWQIDPVSGAPVKRFGITDGGGVLRADFEDIQVLGDRVYLVTSAGELVAAREAPDGETTPALLRTRGLGGACEVEGMTWDQSSRSLLLLCKNTAGKRWKGQVVILAVSPDSGRFEPEPRLIIPEREIQRLTGVKRFQGSAIARHPTLGTYFMVAGPQRTVVEVDSTGKVLAGGRLSAQRHRQPEGIAFTQDQTLLISDEAAGKTATLTGYAYRR
jgi:uncharacterized protein YjiK